MCGYFCLAFIDFMFAGKTLLQLFSPHGFEKNDNIIKTCLTKINSPPRPGAGLEIILEKVF